MEELVHEASSKNVITPEAVSMSKQLNAPLPVQLQHIITLYKAIE